LIPIAMVLYRLMENPVYIYAVVTVMFIISVWVFLRLLKGISIIYDIKPLKVYAGGILLLIACLLVVYGYFDYTQSTSIYLKYLLQSVSLR
ncbi:MAG: hypothetical protein HYZ33_02650, partial [Ignavibacteriales bacterium]|nr:hypothetical protein [Ignavibacteriales bacterium]